MSSASGRRRAATVAAGILSSRLLGFVRERVVAHYFGLSAFADVFSAALRAPNVLQNLLGEQSLSAAFIPIYTRMVEAGKGEEARRFAGVLFGFLLLLVSILALLGVVFAEPIVALLTPGFLDDAVQVAAGEQTVDRFPLAVRAVRWIFPMTALLVLSAWALAILNSHRRFFLPYFAPVLWNLCIIGAFVVAARWWLPQGGEPLAAETHLLFAGCAGALVGGAVQFLVQLPLAIRCLGGFRPSLSRNAPGLRRALSAFGPAVTGRGVVQLSMYLDLFLASFLAVGALTAVRFGSFLYILPVSLFGLSVAAAELPELSRNAREKLRDPAVQRRMGERVRLSLGQIALLVVPTFTGYLLFGVLLVGALFLTGEFTVADQWLVTVVLGAYTVGLPASTASRMVQNLFFSLEDTRTPMRVAIARVVASGSVAAATMLYLDTLSLASLLDFGQSLGLPVGSVPGSGALFLGAVGLGLGSAAGSWLELALLRRALSRELPGFRLPVAAVARMVGTALAAALPAVALWAWLGRAVQWPPWLLAPVVVGLYAVLYLALASRTAPQEFQAWVGEGGPFSFLLRRR